MSSKMETTSYKNDKFEIDENQLIKDNKVYSTDLFYTFEIEKIGHIWILLLSLYFITLGIIAAANELVSAGFIRIILGIGCILFYLFTRGTYKIVLRSFTDLRYKIAGSEKRKSSKSLVLMKSKDEDEINEIKEVLSKVIINPLTKEKSEGEEQK